MKLGGLIVQLFIVIIGVLAAFAIAAGIDRKAKERGLTSPFNQD